jgi:hypothetical protein
VEERIVSPIAANFIAVIMPLDTLAHSQKWLEYRIAGALLFFLVVSRRLQRHDSHLIYRLSQICTFSFS